MADEITEQTPVPYWAKTEDGRVFVEGEDVTEYINPEFNNPPPEPEKPNPDNAQVEGKEAEPEEAEEPGPEPEKEPEKEPEPEPEPEKTEPEKLKFKLKFRGTEEEKEYDHAELQDRLNKLRMFEENQKELWEKKKAVEPYENIVKSDWFKAKLEEAYETGELTRPAPPAEAPAPVQYEILKRQAEPDHEEVLAALRDFAMRLPPQAAQLLDSDPTVFLPEYDRVAKELRESKAAPPEPEKPKVDPEDAKRKLAFKETAKKSAVVAQPGTQAEAVSPLKAWEKKDRALVRALKDPANAHRNLEIAAEILIHRESKP